MPIAAIVDIPMPSHSSTSITPARAESIHEEEPTSGSLPVAGPQRLFCVHAGISPALDDLDALRAIKRPCKVHSDQVRLHAAGRCGVGMLRRKTADLQWNIWN